MKLWPGELSLITNEDMHNTTDVHEKYFVLLENNSWRISCITSFCLDLNIIHYSLDTCIKLVFCFAHVKQGGLCVIRVVVPAL